MSEDPVAIPIKSDGTEIATATDPFRVDPTGTTAQPVTDNGGSLTIDATALPLPMGAATETTLATRATQATLEAARVLLVSLDGKDFATQTTLATRASEATLEAARALLVSINAKDFATQTTLATLATESKLEAVRALLATINSKDFATQATLAAFKTAFDSRDLATQATLLAADGRLTTIDAVLDSIKDTDGIKKITDELPAGTQEIGAVRQGTKAANTAAWPIKITNAGGDKVATLTNDAGIIRQEIVGKVSVVGATAPPSTTAQEIFADIPLVVGTHDTTFTIPDGETFHLQNITAGNEDPSKGAVIEVIFDNGSEHVIERVYTNGSTVSISFNDVATARDGIALLGNGAGTSDIIVRRIKYAGTDIAIDAIVTGYTS